MACQNILSTSRLLRQCAVNFRTTSTGWVQPVVTNHSFSTSCPQYSSNSDDKGPKKAKTPIGRLDKLWKGKSESMEPQEVSAETETNPYAAFPDDKNPETGEIGGPRGPEPTRFGDWERKGRAIDF